MSGITASSRDFSSALRHDPTCTMEMMERWRVNDVVSGVRISPDLALAEGIARASLNWIMDNPEREAVFIKETFSKLRMPPKYMSSLYTKTPHSPDTHTHLQDYLNYVMAALWSPQYVYMGKVLDEAGVKREFTGSEAGHHHKFLRDRLRADFADGVPPQVRLHPIPGKEDERPEETYYDAKNNILHIAWRKMTANFEPVQETIAHAFAAGLKYAVFLHNPQTKNDLAKHNVWRAAIPAQNKNGLYTKKQESVRRRGKAYLANQRRSRCLRTAMTTLAEQAPFYAKGANSICVAYQSELRSAQGEQTIGPAVLAVCMAYADTLIKPLDRGLGAAMVATMSDACLQGLSVEQRNEITYFATGQSRFGLPFKDWMPNEQVQAGRIIENFRYVQPVQEAFAAAAKGFKATGPLQKLQDWQTMPWERQRVLVKEIIDDMDRCMGAALGCSDLFNDKKGQLNIVHYVRYEPNSGYPCVAVYPCSYDDYHKDPKKYRDTGISMKIDQRSWPSDRENNAGVFGRALSMTERPVFIVMPRTQANAATDLNPIWGDRPANVLARLARLYEFALPDRLSALDRNLAKNYPVLQQAKAHLQPDLGDVATTWRRICEQVQADPNARGKLSSEFRQQISNHPYYKSGQIFA